MGDPSSGPFDIESPTIHGRHNRTSSQFSNYNKSGMGVEKQASQLTMSVIESIQGKNPSFKFQAKLLEREKKMESDTIANRIKKLEYEERRALKTLNQTIKAHQEADKVKQRKEEDAARKAQWYTEKEQQRLKLRAQNLGKREETK